MRSATFLESQMCTGDQLTTVLSTLLNQITNPSTPAGPASGIISVSHSITPLQNGQFYVSVVAIMALK